MFHIVDLTRLSGTFIQLKSAARLSHFVQRTLLHGRPRYPRSIRSTLGGLNLPIANLPIRSKIYLKVHDKEPLGEQSRLIRLPYHQSLALFYPIREDVEHHC